MSLQVSKVKGILALLLMAAVLLAACGPVATPSPAPTTAVLPTATTPATPTPVITYDNPIYPDDFPDPYVLRVQDDYYAYSTNSNGANVPALKISAGFSQVEELGDVLPDLPEWAAENRSLTWAPGVLARDGQYVLYYTARYTQIGLQCISRAVSDSPAGPFVDDSLRPFICQIDLGGSIDPSPFVDSDGQAYLLWKNDGNCCGKPVGLWIQPLGKDGLTLTGEPQELIRRNLAWETPLIEGPAMVAHDSKYYLFYSGNWWESLDYAMGYAICDSPTGPCTKPEKKPWFVRQGKVQGPGGGDFFYDITGRLWMAYHAWTAPEVGYPEGARSLRVEPVIFEAGEPETQGPTDDPQPIP